MLPMKLILPGAGVVVLAVLAAFLFGSALGKANARTQCAEEQATAVRAAVAEATARAKTNIKKREDTRRELTTLSDPDLTARAARWLRE